MISRRDMLVGGMLLGASAGAYALAPRHKMSLLGGRDLERLIPKQFAGWQALPSDALVVPEEEDSLASRLYTKSVGRIYADRNGNAGMLLVAYGGTQSDSLQLHRPEVCYPAVGFNVGEQAAVSIPLGNDVVIPGRRLVAASNLRTEQILYWTRVGEFLPASGREQRWLRLRSELSGSVPDGALVRISTIGTDVARGLELNSRLARDLMTALSPDARRVLIGTQVARALAS